MENIVEICVAIDIAILGIAYPIIIDKISSIGDKYSSNYLPNLFNSEFPQQSTRLKFWRWDNEVSLFKLILVITILSFFLIIINADPWFGWDNIFINNSAELIVLILSVILTYCFFKWLDIVVLYNGKATTLLRYIITRYHEKTTSPNKYHLKAINEFAIYAIRQQDEHLQKTLVEFYYTVFSNIRKNHDNSKPLEYNHDLYEMVYRLCYELMNTENKYLFALEHRAVSGWWFLGEDFQEIEISELTYQWLWRILTTICENEKFVRMYWGTAHQYYEMKLPYILPEYGQDFQISNKQQIDKREKERIRFLEFHYALGGLLLYREEYRTLKYIFHYTQSQPPRYALLTANVTEIFKRFELFVNEFKQRGEPVEYKYYFPDLDNLGSRRQVSYWIGSYLTLLFVRVYVLSKDFSNPDLVRQPNLPDKISELRDWSNAVQFFEKCLNDILSNEDLLEVVGFEDVVAEKKDEMQEYLVTLKAAISAKIGFQNANAPLSHEKVKTFKETSTNIIRSAFSEYKCVANPSEYIDAGNDLKLTVTGQSNLMSKSTFLDNTGVAHLNYDSILAESIASQNIRKYIPNSFLVAKTRRYLLNEENIVEGLKAIMGKTKDAIIIAVNLTTDNRANLQEFKDKICEIQGSEYRLQDLLFVLKKSELPHIIHRKLDPSVVEEEKLELIEDEINLYSSVLDLTQDEYSSVKEKWSLGDMGDDPKVQITLAFLTLIVFKENRDIVQVNIASKYRELGIQNSLKDIEPLN